MCWRDRPAGSWSLCLGGIDGEVLSHIINLMISMAQVARLVSPMITAVVAALLALFG
jgi:hypothetical protein